MRIARRVLESRIMVRPHLSHAIALAKVKVRRGGGEGGHGYKVQVHRATTRAPYRSVPITEPSGLSAKADKRRITLRAWKANLTLVVLGDRAAERRESGG